jgi:hypothetical protein
MSTDRDDDRTLTTPFSWLAPIADVRPAEPAECEFVPMAARSGRRVRRRRQDRLRLASHVWT